MKINTAKIKQIGDTIRVSSFIESSTQPEINQDIWFELSVKYKSYIAKNMDSFLLATIIVAMGLGEDVYVDGNLSPRILKRIKDIQAYYAFMSKGQYEIVSVYANSCKIEKNKLFKPRYSTSFFSGGVDSFYTIIENQKEIQDCYKIKKSIFILGYDMCKDDHADGYSKISNTYKEYLMNTLGIDLINITVNHRELTDLVIHKKYTIGTILYSTGLLLSPMISTLYIPSSISYSYTDYWGTNPISDELCETENMEVIYDGGGMKRMDKIKIVSEFEDSYNKLRVCLQNPESLYNCSKCEKCARTMLELELQNKLEKYTVFNNKLEEAIKGIKLKTYSQKTFFKDIYNNAIKIGNKRVANMVIEKLDSNQ